ncbi:TPA: hypothetical protein P0E12_004979 [Vibrio harveyi]|nr:hypothetical protein [Vibrio harveyi]
MAKSKRRRKLAKALVASGYDVPTAAMKAGYSESHSYALMKDPEFLELVKYEAFAERVNSGVSYESLRQSLNIVANYDVRDFFDGNGRFVGMGNLDALHNEVIDGLEAKVVDGSLVYVPRFMSKEKARERLLKIYEREKQLAETTANQMTDAEIIEELRRLGVELGDFL